MHLLSLLRLSGKFFLAALYALVSLAVLHAQQPILSEEEPILVPDTRGGTDFIEVDQERGRLMAGHPGNGTLDVFDSFTGKLIKSLPTGAAMDTAVDAKGGRYIVSVSKQQKIVVITDSLTITGSIPLPGPADVLTFHSANGCAYVGHDDASEIWAVAVNVGKVVASIPISVGPEALVCDEVGNRIYANVRGGDSVSVIDPTSNKVVANWPTAPAKNPHGLVLDTANRRLISVGGNGKLVAISLDSGKVDSSVDVAPHVDQIAYDPGLKRVYCASGAGVISVVDASGSALKTLGDVPTHKGAHAVAVDNRTHAVWIAFSDGTKRGEGKSYIQRLK